MSRKKFPSNRITNDPIQKLIMVNSGIGLALLGNIESIGSFLPVKHLSIKEEPPPNRSGSLECISPFIAYLLSLDPAKQVTGIRPGCILKTEAA